MGERRSLGLLDGPYIVEGNTVQGHLCDNLDLVFEIGQLSLPTCYFATLLTGPSCQHILLWAFGSLEQQWTGKTSLQRRTPLQRRQDLWTSVFDRLT